MKAGELVVVRTDKSGKFSIMSIEEYRRAGEVHTNKDKEVTVEFLMKNQRKVNGHLSMLLKTFMVGRSHGHYERIRNLKITHSLSVAPLYLLFKDHKGWTLDTGKPPPSRPVVSAGSGQNDHLSEIVSHILEPIVKMRPGGMEVTSTGDFISRINGINEMIIPIEEIDLEEIDRKLEEQESEQLREIDEHLDGQARDAQERYDSFDEEMMKMDNNLESDNLPEGWSQDYDCEQVDFTGNRGKIPDGLKIKPKNGGSSRKIESEDSSGMETGEA